MELFSLPSVSSVEKQPGLKSHLEVPVYESHHGQYKVNFNTLFCVHCHMPHLPMNCGGTVMSEPRSASEGESNQSQLFEREK